MKMYHGVKRYFQVPWHVQDARVVDVITLVCYPLMSSLLAIAVSLNTMVFMRMYSRSLAYWCINTSYSCCISAALSFMLFVLTAIYGRPIVAVLAYLSYQAFFIQQVPLCMELLWQTALESKIDRPVVIIMRTIVIIASIVVFMLTIRLGFVIIALVDAMMHGGMLWDLDDAKERRIGDHPRNFSITVPEDE